MTVEVDGAVVGQAGEGAVAGEGPCGTLFNGDDRVVLHRSAALGVVHDVDGAGEAGVVLQGEVQRRDAVHRDGAVQGLGVGGQLDLCAVLARSAPAVGGRVARNGHQVGGAVLVGQGHAGQSDDRVGIGDVEQVAVFAGQGAAGH